MNGKLLYFIGGVVGGALGTWIVMQKKYREKKKDYYKEYHRKWQQDNKERVSQYQKEWRAKKKDIDNEVKQDNIVA